MATKWNKVLRVGLDEQSYDDSDITSYDMDNIAYDSVWSFEPTVWTKRITP